MNKLSGELTGSVPQQDIDLITIYFEQACNCDLPALEKKFMRCTARATILHLKKYLALKILNDVERHEDIEILCKGEIPTNNVTLRVVYLTQWRLQHPILTLEYRLRV